MMKNEQIRTAEQALAACKPCPNCGSAPRMKLSSFDYRRGGMRDTYYLYRYECRKWWGLRICHSPWSWVWIERYGHGLLWRGRPVRLWNESVDEATKAQSQPRVLESDS